MFTHAWPGTGRVIDVPMTVLSVREQFGDPGAEPIIERGGRLAYQDLYEIQGM